MGTQARATFTVKSWDEKPVVELDGGGKFTRASVVGVYSGEIEGEGTWENVMFFRADGTAIYVGLERITGRIGGRAGSVVLQSTGAYDGTEARSTVSVVAGSATGELAGLEGEGRFAAPHGLKGSLDLEYRFV